MQTALFPGYPHKQDTQSNQFQYLESNASLGDSGKGESELPKRIQESIPSFYCSFCRPSMTKNDLYILRSSSLQLFQTIVAPGRSRGRYRSPILHPLRSIIPPSNTWLFRWKDGSVTGGLCRLQFIECGKLYVYLIRVVTRTRYHLSE